MCSNQVIDFATMNLTSIICLAFFIVEQEKMLKKKSIVNHLWELKRPLTVRLDHYRPPDPVTVNRNLTSCCHSVRPGLSSGWPLVPFIGGE
jgi:hypothetical protein